METESLVKLSEPIQSESSSLLSKYGIPVQHLDYEYIQKCKSARELEKIVVILRSNEEGCFPHLTEVAERKLQELKPKSKLLYKNVQVINRDELEPQQKREITAELHEFVQKMKDFDNELVTRGKCNVTACDVRQTIEVVDDTNKKTKINRIKSTDYASWDKYDVDSECLKIDLQEEKLKKAANERKNVGKSTARLITELSTNAEVEFEANCEKNKGNEFYKNGEYEKAIEHYTNSIKIKANATTYTNRAMANIKIKNYGFAVEDCKAALKLDKYNIKAHIRLAEIYEFLKKFDEAIESLDKALVLDANNSTVQNIAARLEKHRLSKKKMRFKIEEASYKIPIPGTSNMNPPFYIIADSNSKNQCVVKKPQLLHLINMDANTDADECTVNHLQNRCSKNYSKQNEMRKSIFTTKKIDDYKQRDAKHGSGDDNNNSNIKNVQVEENEITSPFVFLNVWNSISKDVSLQEKAAVLRRINFNRLSRVIGSKLDSKMLSDILHCLQLYFLRGDDVDTIHGILSNLPQISRFSIIKLFMTRDDLENFGLLIDFLKDNQKPLSNDIKKLYM